MFTRNDLTVPEIEPSQALWLYEELAGWNTGSENLQRFHGGLCLLCEVEHLPSVNVGSGRVSPTTDLRTFAQVLENWAAALHIAANNLDAEHKAEKTARVKRLTDKLDEAEKTPRKRAKTRPETPGISEGPPGGVDLDQLLSASD